MQVFNPFFFFPVDHSFGDTLVISPGTFSYQNKDSCQKYMHTHHIFHLYCLWACQLSLYSREFPALNLSDLYDLSTKSLATAMCWHKRHGIAVTWLWWRCFHRHVNKLCTRTASSTRVPSKLNGKVSKCKWLSMVEVMQQANGEIIVR